MGRNKRASRGVKVVAHGSSWVYNMRVRFAVLLAVGVMIFAAACGGDSEPEAAVSTNGEPEATINTSKGAIVVKLFPDAAPKTVDNFISLSRKGFYDGVIFHRVIEGFMIQGGDPKGTGSGGPGYTLEYEIDPSLVYDGPGILAMAGTPSEASSSSRWHPLPT